MTYDNWGEESRKNEHLTVDLTKWASYKNEHLTVDEEYTTTIGQNQSISSILRYKIRNHWTSG